MNQVLRRVDSCLYQRRSERVAQLQQRASHKILSNDTYDDEESSEIEFQGRWEGTIDLLNIPIV